MKPTYSYQERRETGKDRAILTVKIARLNEYNSKNIYNSKYLTPFEYNFNINFVYKKG